MNNSPEELSARIAGLEKLNLELVGLLKKISNGSLLVQATLVEAMNANQESNLTSFGLLAETISSAPVREKFILLMEKGRSNIDQTNAMIATLKNRLDSQTGGEPPQPKGQ